MYSFWPITCSSVQEPKALSSLLEAEQADVICVQETKLQEKNAHDLEAKLGLPGWHIYWNCSVAKKGYSGTALFSKYVPCTT